MSIKRPRANLALVLAAGFAFVPSLTLANLITIEPDIYVPGTDLSNLFNDVSFSHGDGGKVYAAPVYPVDTPTTGPLGTQVFSRSPNSNSEWIYPTFESIRPGDGLVITFNTTVDFISILAAEVRRDAGCCTPGDPLQWLVYDSADTLVWRGEVGWVDGGWDYSTTEFSVHSDIVDRLGVEPPESPLRGQPAYPVLESSFSFHDIHRVVIAGDSEPTTLDRLQFNTVSVPEPNPALLLVTGLLLIGASRLRSVPRHTRNPPR